MSSAEASHAKIFPTREGAPELPESVRDSGGNYCEPFAWYDQSTSSWRTWQRSLVEGWELFLETWPRAGMTRNGIAYQRKPLARPMRGTDGLRLPTPRNCSAMKAAINNAGAENRFPNYETVIARAFLPTLGKNEFKGSSRKRYRGSPHFRGAKMSEGLRTSLDDPIYLHPSFAELVMGYQIGWTELGPAGTP